MYFPPSFQLLSFAKIYILVSTPKSQAAWNRLFIPPTWNGIDARVWISMPTFVYTKQKLHIIPPISIPCEINSIRWWWYWYKLFHIISPNEARSLMRQLVHKFETGKFIKTRHYIPTPGVVSNFSGFSCFASSPKTCLSRDDANKDCPCLESSFLFSRSENSFLSRSKTWPSKKILFCNTKKNKKNLMCQPQQQNNIPHVTWTLLHCLFTMHSQHLSVELEAWILALP